MKKTIFLLSLAFGLTAMFNLQAQTVSETFTLSDPAWVVPADVYQIYVEAWGGGGAGGGTTAAGVASANAGAGGGGGGFAAGLISVTPGQSLDIVVAQQVLGVNGAAGPDGEDSYIVGYEGDVLAYGGAGGAVNDGIGGAGGAGVGAINETGVDGGDGDEGIAVSSGTGGDGANGGGAGGAALTGIGTEGPGNPGDAIGGGGGGARTSWADDNDPQTGGAGAAGQIILTYTPEPGGPLAVPISNWALLIGIGLIATFMVVRFRNIA